MQTEPDQNVTKRSKLIISIKTTKGIEVFIET